MERSWDNSKFGNTGLMMLDISERCDILKTNSCIWKDPNTGGGRRNRVCVMCLILTFT